MPDVDWPSIRAQASESFGETPPHPEVEDEIIAVFQRDPRIVMRAISDVAAKVRTGKIRSGWRVLRAQVVQAAQPRSQATVEVSHTRDRDVARARQWMRTAGVYIPSVEAMESELFAEPQMTPSLEFLEQHERDTRDAPGRYLYDTLLKASIERTREVGPEPIPDTGGILGAYADDRALRGEIAELWLKLRPVGEQAEHEAEKRAGRHVEQLARIAAARAERGERSR